MDDLPICFRSLAAPGHWKRPSLGLPRTQPKEVTVVDAKTHKVVGTIPTGTGPRPGTISPDGKFVYMNVDDLMGFLVIDTAARKVISKATYTLTPDEQAVRSRSHGIAVANDGKEVWSNDVVHNLTFVFDVTVTPPKQIARFAVGRQPYWIVPSKDSKTVYVELSEQRRAHRLRCGHQEGKGAHPVPEGFASHAHAGRGRAAHCSGDDIAINRVRRRGMIRRAFIGFWAHAPRLRPSDGHGPNSQTASLRYAPLSRPVRIPLDTVAVPWQPALFTAEAMAPATATTASRRVLISGVLFRKGVSEQLCALCLTCPHEQCKVDLSPIPIAWLE